MQMLLAKIVNPEFQASLDKLARQDLPVRGMYKMKGIFKTLRQEIESFEECRNDLAKKFANRDPETSTPIVEKSTDPKTGREVTFYRMEPEAMFKFSAEIGELTKVEVEVPEVHLRELGDEIKLNASDLLLLEFITVEE